MVRPFLLFFISFLLPVLLFGQEDGKPVKDSTEKKDPSSFKNEVGIGFHAGYPIITSLRGAFVYNEAPHLVRSIFQVSYKRELQYFSIRGGIGFGGWFIIQGIPGYNDGEFEFREFLLSVGVEKAIWRTDGAFQMNIALDYFHGRKWIYINEFRIDGAGLTLVNDWSLNPRSSISLEAGIGFGRSGYSGQYGVKWNERQTWQFVITKIPYRNLVLSYNYHF